MQSFADSILKPIKDLWQAFLDLLSKLFETLLDVLKDVFFFIIDKLLDLVTSLLGVVDLSAITENLPGFDAIPEDVLNVLGLLGFAQCMAIIGGAILIRIGLQLIPFVRLGS